MDRLTSAVPKTGEFAAGSNDCDDHRSRELLVLKSPKAGMGRQGGMTTAQRIDAVVAAWKSKTGNPAHATSNLPELSERLAASQSSGNPLLVVAAGGDGTLRLASQMTMHTGIPIVPLPLGTENLVARWLRISADPIQYVDSLCSARLQTIDAMNLIRSDRQQLALIMTTAGFDASVVRRVHLKRRGHISHWSYALPLLRQWIHYPLDLIQVTLDRKTTFECGWATVFNFPIYASRLPITTSADPSDGKLNVVCFHRSGRWNSLRYLSGILRHRHEGWSDVTSTTATEIELSPLNQAGGPATNSEPTKFPRIRCQADGDYLGPLPLRIKLEPASVTLAVP